MGVFFNRQLVSIGVPYEFLFSSTCFFIRTKQTSYRGFLRKMNKNYIDDVLSLNNSKFVAFVDHISPIELEIKDTTDIARYTSYLDLHFETDNEDRSKTKF